MFKNVKSVEFPEAQAPRLLVVIDTEEEFDWAKGPDRSQTSVESVSAIPVVQDIFKNYQICPCYVVDYPIANQEKSSQLMRALYQNGECEVGAQLHPWVNPPLVEELTRPNMYPGNLDRELERQKISLLKAEIVKNIGCEPMAYKAGRYGYGKNTSSLLSELGFSVDLSVCPPLDFRKDGGPDYRSFSAKPFWFDGDNDNQLLEIPCTGAYVGWAENMANPLFRAANKFPQMKLPGLLSRAGAVDRLMLSPEGYTSEEHIKLTKHLYAQGVRTFTWSFHSPSLVPGNTTYVQNKAQLENFIDSFYRFFDYFFGELGGIATSPGRLLKELEDNREETL